MNSKSMFDKSIQLPFEIRNFLKNLIQSFDPKEILVSKENKNIYSDLLKNFKSIFYLEDWIFKLG